MSYKIIGILLWIFSLFALQDLLAQEKNKTELYRLIELAESDSKRVNLKLQLVDILEAEGDKSESLREISSILRLSTMDRYENGYLRGLFKMGEHYLNRELPDSAKIPVREGVSQSKTPQFRLLFLNQQGTIIRMEGFPEKSIQVYKDAYALADSIGLYREKAAIAYNLAIAYKLTGDLSTSFENLYRGLVNIEDAGDSELMAKILNSIGKMYYDLENPSEGIYYLEQSEQLSRQYSLDNNLISVLTNLGISHLALENVNSAEDYLTEARERASKSGNEIQKVLIGYNLGLVNLKKGNLTEAQIFFETTLEQSREHEFGEGIFHNSIGMGDLYKHQRRYDEAVAWYHEALEESFNMNADHFTGQALEKLYLVNRDAGRHLDALEALEVLRAHTENIRSIEREQARAEYEARLESRRQEQENRILIARQSEQEARLQLQKAMGIGVLVLLSFVLGITIFLYRNVRFRGRLNTFLRERNLEISSKNKELDHLNNIKNKMFAVVAHDLRGPLSSLQSLLYLLREHDLSKEDLDEITNSLERSLHDNATTMENLLAWAKSQMNGIVVNYRIFKLIAAVEAVYSQVKFQAEQKKVNIQIDVDSELKVYADYDMMKLVLRNLVSNAVKFTDEDDKITIRATSDSEKTTISVEDTGIGIKHNDQEKIFGDDHFSNAGTKNEQGSGLGLALCKEFVEKHEGEIWFQSEHNKGTTFIFSLPVHKETSLPEDKKDIRNSKDKRQAKPVAIPG